MATASKLVLITGLLLASHEYHVFLGSRDPARGEESARVLRALPEIKGTSVDAAAAYVQAEYGRLNVLVNNAGIAILDEPPSRESYRKVLDVNLIGALSTTEAFLDLLRQSLEKRLIFVSSSTGSITHAADPESPYYSPRGIEYRTGKAALNMMMVLYWVRLKEEGFKVFGADPGLCATNLTRDPESLRMRNAAEPSKGVRRVATVVKGERDADAGKVIGDYGVSPF
ncbi:NAD(P)-binding protein [Aspergillus homomorphus CBS 101889]|uniref:NAD(P)-binding protein n=1 Tax=Aspergillus homomorphus (strain CBS 101889) TaxID=1450537 RepID=A0A395I475_ASPHC|nr:NAD(P)-binding protein [Aspergillus homomorphus CBS 101889]RAL14539.1 NAD(P)-binding protein [Aspergillus homomorphus CBS 101889]